MAAKSEFTQADFIADKQCDSAYTPLTTNNSNKANIRRADLDWIRVLAVPLLVPFHSALIFNLNPYAVMYVKDSINSGFLDIFSGWIHQFHMPILFYVAGASTYFALKKRTLLQYAKERFLKLLIPALAAICLLVPPMTYITSISLGNETTFSQHFVGFWNFNVADLNGISGCFTTAHIWFLIFLFVFSIVGLPLFIAFKGGKGINKIIEKIGGFGFIAILFVISALAARTNILGGMNPLYYFIAFFTGFVFMIDQRVQNSIDKFAGCALVLGICLEICRHFFMGFIYDWTHSGNLIFVLKQLNRWFWLLGLLGFGHRYLNKSSNLLKYLSSASFPFYIFHLLINTIIGFYIIKLPIGVCAKYLLIVVITIATTFGVYELVKRIPLIRFLFGIRKK